MGYWSGQRISGWLPVAMICVLFLLGGSVAVFAAGPELDASRKELEDIRRRIGQTARTLEEKKQAERSAVADLGKVEKALAAMGGRVAAIEAQLRELDRKIAAAQGSIGQTGTEIDGLKSLVSRRLVALYKGSDEGLVRTVFSPHSSAEISENYLYWQRIVQHDHALLGDYRLRLDTQKEGLQQLSGLRTEQEQLKGELQGERDEMSKAARVKQQLLTRVRQDKQYLARELVALKERAERVDSLIRKLETVRSKAPTTPGTGIVGQKGRLSWPVAGRVRIPFGNSRHPELGTPYQSQGLELEVSGDRPIQAVWPGKVVFASAFKGYGNLLILDHGEGYYTLYAQAARLDCRVGEKVARGAKIGVTDGQAGRFYFEIRKGGTPLDPKDWLE